MSTLDPTIIQIAALAGAVGTGPTTMIEASDRLGFQPGLTAALIGRAVALDLIGRDADGLLALTERGRTFLTEGTTDTRSAITSASGARKPVADTLRQRGWAAMRLSSRFTTGTIAKLAARVTDTWPEDNLRRYILALCRAGYVVRLPKRVGQPEVGAAAPMQWKLVRDTGPHAPVLRRRGTCFYDPNLQTHVDLANAEVRHAA
jgi:hypothetical protein